MSMVPSAPPVAGAADETDTTVSNAVPASSSDVAALEAIRAREFMS
jgi:hypothetical protein